MNDQLNRIEKMLAAILMNNRQLWWIGGYVYGRTSNDDPFIILYPASDNLKEKVVRVYEHDFRKLPSYIDTRDVPADTEANPDKTQAAKKGIYHECQAFQIVCYEGKETQMGPERRFGDVLRVSSREPESPQARPGGPQRNTVAPQDTRPVAPPVKPAAPPKPTQSDDLPDYRAMAIRATTVEQFVYGAYMTLRDDRLYTDNNRVQKLIDTLFSDWRPGLYNAALLDALKVYRDERTRVEEAGSQPADAHRLAAIPARAHYVSKAG